MTAESQECRAERRAEALERFADAIVCSTQANWKKRHWRWGSILASRTADFWWGWADRHHYNKWYGFSLHLWGMRVTLLWIKK